jgi:hypothetical protein
MSESSKTTTRRRDSELVRDGVPKPGHDDTRESGHKGSHARPKSSTSIRNASKTYANARLAKP